jgi:chromodomain-helicase-DNA-binding protein 6
MIESSGKLSLLDKLLPKLFLQGHKVLIFSQMVKVLNIIEDFIRYKGYLYERLDGSTKSTDRDQSVKRFNNPAFNRFIMLLSTKAGGLGLNLTSADTVIIFDSDWNPQNDLQAQARVHRIGQTKAVNIYRLITRKTYEMHMFHQASLKLGLDRAVLAYARNEQDEEAEAKLQKDNMNAMSNKDKLSMSSKEIDELLKRGAYDVFREDDSEQIEFLEADIDTLLERRSRKIDLSIGDNKGVNASLGGFSKASYVSADQNEDVDINDPDFWKKAIGLNDIQESNDLLLEDGVGRTRRQIKNYDEENEEDEGGMYL